MAQRTDFPFEIIVQDDASTDGTQRIIREYAGRYPAIIRAFYEKKNLFSTKGGITYIWNSVIQKARGTYIAICEADDFWTDTGKLQEQIDALRRHPECGLCYTKAWFLYQHGGKKICGGSPVHSFVDEVIVNAIPSPTALFKKALFEQYEKDVQPETKGWPTPDYPLWLYLYWKTRFYFLDKVTAASRIRSGSLSHPASSAKQRRFEEAITQIRSWFLNYTLSLLPAPPLVSVVVPCYNQGAYLDECLRSVFEQTYQNWECVIVNDGSQDESEEIAKRWTARERRFRYIRKQNEGVSLARDDGIRASSGTFILPLDGDDRISADYLAKAMLYFAEHPHTKLVYCRAELFGTQSGPWNLPRYEYSELLWHNTIFCSAIYRRADFDKTEGYRANMVLGFEDWDFWVTLLDADDSVYQIPEILFHYRIKAVSRTTQQHKIDTTGMMHRTLIQNNLGKYAAHLGDYADVVFEFIRLKEKCALQEARLTALTAHTAQIENSRSYRLARSAARFVRAWVPAGSPLSRLLGAAARPLWHVLKQAKKALS